MEVAISTTAPKDKNGTITYLKRFPSMQSAAVGAGAGAGGEVKGVFAFSFYADPKDSYARWEHYIQGMQTYVNIVKDKEKTFYETKLKNGSWVTEEEKMENPFFGWKVVIYTDQQTHDLISKDNLKIAFVKDDDVDFAIVKWDYYSKNKNYEGQVKVGEVNGDVLRVMRFRAFFDFKDVPVFVRDADTLWVPSSGRREFSGDHDTILKWEANFYEAAKTQPKPYIFGTSLNYLKRWHVNTLKNKSKKLPDAPLGVYAGLQSVVPLPIPDTDDPSLYGPPCFDNFTLWNQAIDYILTRSVDEGEIILEGRFTHQKFSNNQASKYGGIERNMGKDEQILLYVFLPTCFDSIFFFELYMDSFLDKSKINENKKVKKTTQEVYFSKEKYPLSIFSGTGDAKAHEALLRGKFAAFIRSFPQPKKAGGKRKTRRHPKKRKGTRRKI